MEAFLLQYMPTVLAVLLWVMAVVVVLAATFNSLSYWKGYYGNAFGIMAMYSAMSKDLVANKYYNRPLGLWFSYRFNLLTRIIANAVIASAVARYLNHNYLWLYIVTAIVELVSSIWVLYAVRDRIFFLRRKLLRADPFSAVYVAEPVKQHFVRPQ